MAAPPEVRSRSRMAHKWCGRDGIKESAALFGALNRMFNQAQKFKKKGANKRSSVRQIV